MWHKEIEKRGKGKGESRYRYNIDVMGDCCLFEREGVWFSIDFWEPIVPTT